MTKHQYGSISSQLSAFGLFTLASTTTWKWAVVLFLIGGFLAVLVHCYHHYLATLKEGQQP